MEKVAILIEFVDNEVKAKEVAFSGDRVNLEFFYNNINCRTIECVRVSVNEDIWIDEEGLFVGGNPVLRLNIDGNILDLAGNMLITKGANSEGETQLFIKGEDDDLISKWLNMPNNIIHIGFVR